MLEGKGEIWSGEDWVCKRTQMVVTFSSLGICPWETDVALSKKNQFLVIFSFPVSVVIHNANPQRLCLV